MFRYSALTQGCPRYPKNQDALLIYDETHQSNWLKSGKINQQSGIVAISDGVSASAMPHIASKKILTSLAERAVQQSNETALGRCEYIHENLCSLVRNSPKLYSSSATLVAFEWQDYSGRIYHVGDSRAYLINQDNIKLLTTDHSIAQEMLNNKEVTQQEFERLSSFYRGLDKAFVADPLEEPPIPDVMPITLNSNQFLLLCSDGLNEQLTDADIFDCINIQNLENSLINLKSLTEHRGQEDDLSIILLQKI